jgi:lipopolysaccharide biosynthesis protein
MRRPPGERLVFINAWNEWGEGAYLEPDRQFGYSYLNATASILSQTYQDPAGDAFIASHNKRFRKTGETAVVLHLYYVGDHPKCTT